MLSVSGVSDENPLYVCYEQQDSALPEWLLSTISPTLHNQLVGSSGSSCELWLTLMRIFRSHSTTKSAILNGLPPEFNHVVSIITTSRVPFDLQGITTALLDAEARQQGHFSHMVFSINVAAVHKDVSVQSVPLYASQPPPDMFRLSRGSQSSHRGRGRKPIQAYMCCTNDGLHSSYYAHNPTVCEPLRQIQPTLNEIDSTQRGQSSHFHMPAVIGQTSRGSSSSGSNCMHRRSGIISQSMCSTGGHGVQSTGSPGIAVPSTVVDPAWYPDSSATAHMTNDSAKFSDARLYNGGGKLGYLFVSPSLFISPSSFKMEFSLPKEIKLHNGAYVAPNLPNPKFVFFMV
ncbi:hypothetical protein PVK06_040612 [Gossypium arboreum]|uniref:Uncharacterized protein n=1 Tax=Gossypium arboreum TaxID=29729 RepID=A0ABR0N600_GOSAR|nr:hypothetical protein PVK06_040612 [Gossypium arboreum]